MLERSERQRSYLCCFSLTTSYSRDTYRRVVPPHRCIYPSPFHKLPAYSMFEVCISHHRLNLVHLRAACADHRYRRRFNRTRRTISTFACTGHARSFSQQQSEHLTSLCSPCFCKFVTFPSAHVYGASCDSLSRAKTAGAIFLPPIHPNPACVCRHPPSRLCRHPCQPTNSTLYRPMVQSFWAPSLRDAWPCPANISSRATMMFSRSCIQTLLTLLIVCSPLTHTHAD